MINQCTFESNEANFGQSTSTLFYSDFYELKTNGYDCAIYSNSTFTAMKRDLSSNIIQDNIGEGGTLTIFQLIQQECCNQK